MSLHHDFPFETTKLYCKTCKETTVHNMPMLDHICTVCGRKWDEILLRVNLKQNEYGKLQYECIIQSDKPVNSREYPSTIFDSIDECVTWFKEKATELTEATK
jgi:hypothetical protein